MSLQIFTLVIQDRRELHGWSYGSPPADPPRRSLRAVHYGRGSWGDTRPMVHAGGVIRLYRAEIRYGPAETIDREIADDSDIAYI